MHTSRVEGTIARHAAFITGAVVSALAGYISICGLVALFPAGGWVVAAMGAGMEAGKVVGVACWRHTTGPLRAALVALLLVLGSITGLGVFGFLTTAYQADRAPGQMAAAQADRLAADLDLTRAAEARETGRLQRLDAAVDALSAASLLSRAQALRQQQAGERAEVAAALAALAADQRRIHAAMVEARGVHAASELAPLRFAAHALGWTDDEAARLMILLLLAAFDPLGLALVAIGAGSRTRAAVPPVAPLLEVIRGKGDDDAPGYRPQLRLVRSR